MKISDDLLNRYIDNELSKEELDQFNKMLSQDQEAIQKLKALQFVERSAKKIKAFKAPDGFAEKIMAEIKPKLSIRYQKDYFYRIIISVFTISFFAISGFTVSLLLKSNSGTSLKDSYVSEFSQVIIQKLGIVEKFFINTNNMMISSSIILLLLLSLYFIFETRRFTNQNE